MATKFLYTSTHSRKMSRSFSSSVLVAVGPFLPGSSVPYLFFFLMLTIVSLCLYPPPIDGFPFVWLTMGSSRLLIVWSSCDTQLCLTSPFPSTKLPRLCWKPWQTMPLKYCLHHLSTELAICVLQRAGDTCSTSCDDFPASGFPPFWQVASDR